MVIPAIVALLVSVSIAVALVATQRFHAHLSHDEQGGVQKIHTKPVPRVGGLALVGGLIAGGLTLAPDLRPLWILVSLASMPAFGAGLLEDVTKRVGVKSRLSATICSGLIFCLATGYHLTHTDLPGLDWLLTYTWFAILLSAIVIAGVANAVNMIDGVNGLALGTTIIVFFGLAILAAQYGDLEILAICMVSIGALAGVFLLNFPYGLIFLGDAGAYSTGMIIAATAMMLPLRHPEISPLMGLIILGYPITEMLVSIHRRIMRKRSHPSQPDRLHLHSLIFRNTANRLAKLIISPDLRNPITAVLIWPFQIFCVILAILSHTSSTALLMSMLAIVALYLWVYPRLTFLR